jgi:hypothetical protein
VSREAPRASVDYPGSYADLRSWFPDDRACLDYLDWLCWPGAFRCPAEQTAWARLHRYRTAMVGPGRDRLGTIVEVDETDGWPSYPSACGEQYTHQPEPVAPSGLPAHQLLAGVHRVASLVQRRLLGTHQGGVRPGHLQAYLDEFTFRFNRRRSRARGMLFYRLLEQSVQAPLAPTSHSSPTPGPATALPRRRRTTSASGLRASPASPSIAHGVTQPETPIDPGRTALRMADPFVQIFQSSRSHSRQTPWVDRCPVGA